MVLSEAFWMTRNIACLAKEKSDFCKDGISSSSRISQSCGCSLTRLETECCWCLMEGQGAAVGGESLGQFRQVHTVNTRPRFFFEIGEDRPKHHGSCGGGTMHSQVMCQWHSKKEATTTFSLWHECGSSRQSCHGDQPHPFFGCKNWSEMAAISSRASSPPVKTDWPLVLDQLIQNCYSHKQWRYRSTSLRELLLLCRTPNRVHLCPASQDLWNPLMGICSIAIGALFPRRRILPFGVHVRVKKE